jgi:glycerol-3-phosphate dehydrogenase (NAD(P)+)
MKVGFLGAGSWGFCLASLLASKGYQVNSWTTRKELADLLNDQQEHPHLKGHKALKDMHFTTDLAYVLKDADILVESVTSAGIRPVFQKIKDIEIPNCPIVLTSKGIEQHTGLILPDVVVQTLGENTRKQVGFLSGPSFAQDVIRHLPTSVVATAYEPSIMQTIADTFNTQTFRVYPNADIRGVAYGGALKNIIAIACGLAEGLSLGHSAKAALMTRGLHEIRKIAIANGCKAETLNGLSGMGDLCLTCSSIMSRNYRFGHLLAQGLSPKEAATKIEMVVEGMYTCVSTYELSKQLNVSMPVTEMIYKIVYEGLKPNEAAKFLMQRAIKEEHL